MLRSIFVPACDASTDNSILSAEIAGAARNADTRARERIRVEITCKAVLVINYE
jgi:hypothetical protein